MGAIALVHGPGHADDHLFAIAMGFGSVVLFNLRLVGRSGGDQTVAQSVRTAICRG